MAIRLDKNWVMLEDGTCIIRPLKSSQSPSYTLAELNVLAVDFVNENDASRDLASPDAVKFRLFLGMYLTYLAKREKEVGDERSSTI